MEKSIRYTKIKAGQYKVFLNGKEYFVSKLMSSNWAIQTLDREVSEVVASKGVATVWLYKNIKGAK